MRLLLRIILPLPILALGFAVGWLAMHKWKAPEENLAPARSERPVQRAEVIPLERQDYQIMIRTRGIVQAKTETQLTPRISGRIESLHPNFQVGAFFKRGDILVSLDPTDSESQIISAEAQVARAEAALAQEEARAKQAELNWKDLGYTEKANDLVLRIPQLREAHANLKTAQAQLAEARRNKLYTKIVAPFDGCVRERLVGPGQSVGTNTQLGVIFATDYAEVRLPVSPKDLPYTPFQSQTTLAATPAIIRDGLTDHLEGDEQTWTAQLIRSEGVIDDTSRELFLIARIPDPYGLQSGLPPLRIGQPVLAEVQGNLLEDVFVIPRETLRGAFETLLVDNETFKLLRFDIEPFWTDSENFVVTHELPENHSIVASRIPHAANGALIEIIEPESDEPPVEAAKGPEDTSTTEA
ncbi:efflux RND transporter periplasmic adaptor subunit [Roseibacillus persicicus]|uniref:efflux RND transporter periplasmic adaptor subunit n=1 Tax=Roseibacillus persicicus TaxID=454148 RepID=UPI00398B3EC7